MRSPSSFLATVTGNLGLVVATVVFASLSVLTGWIPPRGRVVFFWARAWSRMLLATAGIRVDCRYQERIERGRPYVFMANHQSLYDIPLLIATLPVPTRFLTKRELFRIPVFGWGLHMGGFVPVDRKDPTRARRSFKAAARQLRNGASVLLFPEETRSVDGTLLPFKRGGFLLAARSGATVVPVGLQGTAAVRRRGSLWIRPGRVRVRYGVPLQPIGTDPSERRELERVVRERIEALAMGEPEPQSVPVLR